MTNEAKNEIKKLIADIHQYEHENEHNARCVTLCNEALKLAGDLLNGKDTTRYLLKITTHTGKMQGIKSLSTYKLVCNTCLGLKDNPATICHKCYVDKTLSIYRQMTPALIYNTLLLKYTKLTSRQIPVINDLSFRFESFSDLQNAQHLENLYAIARKNPYTRFALWTKNIKLIQSQKTPKNVNLIISSPILNECLPMANTIIRAIQEKTTCKQVKVFTVYDAEHIEQAGQNCQKHCLECQKCYSKNNKEQFINELLK